MADTLFNNNQGVPWYAGGTNSGGGSFTGEAEYQNSGNDLSSILGQAGLANNVYFGGGPGSAAAATQYYLGQSASKNQTRAPQLAGSQTYAMNQAMQNTIGQNTNAQNAIAQSQGQQNAALGNLANAAAGRGVSAAQAQLQQGTDAAIQANMAMANSARGQAGLANAQKNALTQNGMQTQQAANQAAQLRAQEMQSAQSQYMQGANQMAAQNAALQGQYAGQQAGYMGMFNQNELSNAQLQAQQNALNQQGELAYQQLGFNAQAENMAAMQGNQQAANQLNQANAKNMSSGIGGLIGAAGGALAMFSDERVKRNVHDGGPSIDEALGKMAPHSFQYADAHFGSPGEHQGVMAQELMGSHAGRQMVVKDPETQALAVKIPEAASFLLGATARLHERLEKLEGTRVGTSELQEPHGGESRWTLREEPTFIAARNDRTGELQKVATEPLNADERRQVMAPHGAGPFSRHGDFDVGSIMGMAGGMMGGGGGDSSGKAAPPNTANATSPEMMNAVYKYSNPNPMTMQLGGGTPVQQQQPSGGAPQNIGQGLMSAENSYKGALDAAAKNGDYMAGGI